MVNSNLQFLISRSSILFIIKTSNSEHITLSSTPFLITWNRSTPVINIVLYTVIINAKHWSVTVNDLHLVHMSCVFTHLCTDTLSLWLHVHKLCTSKSHIILILDRAALACLRSRGYFICQISVHWGTSSQPRPWCETWKADTDPRPSGSHHKD